MIKKILIVLIVTPLIIATLVITAALVILNRPTLVINETTLDMAVRHLHPLGIKVEWQHVEPRCSSHGFLDETVGVAFEKICVEMKPAIEKACFDKLDVAARYRFKGFMPELIEVGPLDVHGGNIVVHTPQEQKKDDAKKDAAFSIPKLTVPDWLKRIHLHAINIELDNVEAHVGETTYQIKATVAGTQDEKGRPQTIKAKASLVEQPANRTVNLDAALISPSAFERDDWELQATVDAKLAPTTKATVDAKLNATGKGSIDHIIEARFSEAKITGTARLAGTLTETSFSTELKADANNLSDVVRSVQLPACTIDLKAEELSENRGKLNMTCPVDVLLKKFTLPSPEFEKMYQPPQRVRVNIVAKANTFFVPDPDQKTDGTIELRIQPLTGKLVRTSGGMKINFSGIPSKPIDSWTITSDMDVDFIIDDVANLIAVLATTKYPAPAPFNKFTGPIEFSLEGKVSSATAFGRFPIKLTTKLTSPDQVIDVDSDGELSVGFIGKKEIKETALKLDVKLNDVQLQLPNVAMAGLPRVTPDGRIILNPEKEKAKTDKPEIPFDYDVTVTTPPNNPMRILSNITPKYIPIHVDVNLTNDKMAGTVRITDFPIQLFSRSAILEKLALTLEDPITESGVNGALSMQFPELKLTVNMQGTIEHPVITLRSDPEMSEGDMLSTLLYGEPLNAIDSDKASSVSSMNAAMTDRAMALTSFFMLGSTPIQSIAYNPETKMFSARVRLGKRTSFGVGASGTEKHAGIRTRLGKGFSISTSVDKSDDDDDTAASAMIEWSKRF